MRPWTDGQGSGRVDAGSYERGRVRWRARVQIDGAGPTIARAKSGGPLFRRLRAPLLTSGSPRRIRPETSCVHYCDPLVNGSC